MKNTDIYGYNIKKIQIYLDVYESVIFELSEKNDIKFDKRICKSLLGNEDLMVYVYRNDGKTLNVFLIYDSNNGIMKKLNIGITYSDGGGNYISTSDVNVFKKVLEENIGKVK